MFLKAKIKNFNGHYEIIFDNRNNADLGLANFEDAEVSIEVKKYDGTRTEKQNSALHLYFTLLARALNDAGFDMKKTLRQEIDIPWTLDLVKNNLWRPVQKECLNKKSTKRLNKMEITQVYDIVNRAIAERTGVRIQFPSIENLNN